MYSIWILPVQIFPKVTKFVQNYTTFLSLLGFEI